MHVPPVAVVSVDERRLAATSKSAVFASRSSLWLLQCSLWSAQNKRAYFWHFTMPDVPKVCATSTLPEMRKPPVFFALLAYRLQNIPDGWHLPACQNQILVNPSLAAAMMHPHPSSQLFSVMVLHRCNIDGLRPPISRVAVRSVRSGFAGGWRGSWRPESPWLGVSARLAS